MKKTILWWLLVLVAAAACYLFCTVTCAPICEHSIARINSAAGPVLFLLLILGRGLARIRKHNYKRQIIR
jgi:hypothetical protein